MRPKRLFTTALALAAAGYAARIGILTAFEWRRENKMRAMSDEGPLSKEIPWLMSRTLLEEREFVRELGNFVVKFPKEMARYLKAESM